MTTDIVSVTLKDSARTVHKLFDQLSIHHIPVLFEDGILAGIISKTDIVQVHTGFRLIRNQEENVRETDMLSSILAEDIMTRYLVNLIPDDTLESALHIFLKNRFHAMPVLEQGKLVGILSTYDILWWLYNKKKDIRYKSFHSGGQEGTF